MRCLQNVVQYSGTGEDRKIIREHEFFFSGEKKSSKRTKFEVLLASYETVLRDKKEFQAIDWEVSYSFFKNERPSIWLNA